MYQLLMVVVADMFAWMGLTLKQCCPLVATYPLTAAYMGSMRRGLHKVTGRIPHRNCSRRPTTHTHTHTMHVLSNSVCSKSYKLLMEQTLNNVKEMQDSFCKCIWGIWTLGRFPVILGVFLCNFIT